MGCGGPLPPEASERAAGLPLHPRLRPPVQGPAHGLSTRALVGFNRPLPEAAGEWPVEYSQVTAG